MAEEKTEEKKLTWMEKIKRLQRKDYDKKKEEQEEENQTEEKPQYGYIAAARHNIQTFSQGIPTIEMVPATGMRQPIQEQDIFTEMAERYARSEKADIIPQMTQNFKMKYQNTEQKIRQRGDIYKYKEAELHNHITSRGNMFHGSVAHHKQRTQTFVSRPAHTRKAKSSGLNVFTRKKKVNMRKFL